MKPLSKKSKTAILFVVWVALLAGAWFCAPAFLQVALKSQAYVTHISSIPKDSDRTQSARGDIANLQKDIMKAKLKGANDQVVDLYLQMSDRLEALGQSAKAHQYVSAVIAHDPQNKEAFFRKASLLESLAPASDALAAWRVAIERDPTRSTSYEHLASMTEYVLNDPQQASGIYVEGLVRGGNATALMRSYADFLERQGLKSTALLYWQALEQKDPKDEEAKNHVRALGQQGAATF
ncbi:MAG: hypothetical protein Q8P56_01965 [Candidatus Uhrbacteria bacterium]|nr:hypothetical protein [Candidatus Uhrbacteria bacterium]